MERRRGLFPRRSARRRLARTGRIGVVLAVSAVALTGLVATSGPAQAVTSPVPGITYPYSCATTWVGGSSSTANPVQVTVTDLVNGPGVRQPTTNFVTVQIGVTAIFDSATLANVLATGTTDWSSTNARITWAGTTSPPASFQWHVDPVAQLPDRSPLSFSTAPFSIPVAGDVAPGVLGWDFQANTGVQAGFESGHTQCTPITPVQIYASLLPATGPSCLHNANAWTCRFSYRGTTEYWQVPEDVTAITVEARGASGGTGGPVIDVDRFWPGGRGGSSVATLAVTPGEWLAVTVGGENGFNGGGGARITNTSGGGASDVRRAPYSLTDRLIVAGGGGGGGADVFCSSGCPDDSGGTGGGMSGGGAGGGPGTQTSGGAGQFPSDPTSVALPGSLGAGGGGETGGGGGYYGGGGGASLNGHERIGGGGGGSGFVPAGPGNGTVNGTNSADGSVAITYQSATTPYTSRYTAGEASWIYVDAVFLHSPDAGAAQHDAAMFMAFLAGVIEGQHATPPDLGSAPGTGPLSVTSTYAPADNAALVHAATQFGSDPPTVQRLGAGLMAYLFLASR